MKKFFLLLLAPLLMSSQCESDDSPVFRTEYYIQNSTSIDLILITKDAGEISIESRSSQFMAVSTDLNSFVPPSKNIAFDEVRLYKEETGGNKTISYEQMPIVDQLWSFDEISSYDAEYRLVITNELLK
ncbi:hypothetical protein [Flagellimonas zhangzhouensis]|uniref:Uncharacterized protein n=1 Tax=Flagellimonas zhangzhouensis TaxID=1073328 RepID=A0A1H2YH59_9FLAO|nr:hypothetical protein [Allomuricauda zhangzhouensis]SDQ96105.1 hypothetical protein SAMN05216294_2951 [Allomuricauda zhangzhouensis]SDX03889.1 hypothetical protein SAMN04487892_3069 [Allomuricauda zhangzhouensis]